MAPGPGLLKIWDMSKPSERRRLELLEFSRRLVLSIEALGCSKSAFARSLGVERGRLYHWLTANNYPDPEMLLEMNRVHGLNPDWLLIGRTAGLPAELAIKVQKK